jgi:hypothetical protein
MGCSDSPRGYLDAVILGFFVVRTAVFDVVWQNLVKLNFRPTDLRWDEGVPRLARLRPRSLMYARTALGMPSTTAMIVKTTPMIMAVFHVGVLVVEGSVDIVGLGV